MKLSSLAVTLALFLPASLTHAGDTGVSLSLKTITPQILPEVVSRDNPPTAQGTLTSLWLPPKHTDIVVPLGIPWPLPPLIQTKATPFSASPETFTERIIGQILYVRPESIAAHP